MKQAGSTRSFIAGLLVGVVMTAPVAYALRYVDGGRLVRTQQQVADFAQQVELGTGRSDVERRFAARQYHDVRLRTSEHLFTVEGARGVGAEGWLLLLEFDGDALVAKRFRTHDGHQPPGSKDDVVLPPDEGAPRR